MPQTLIEKIAQRFAVGLPEAHEVRSGDYLSIRPAHVMTHDNTAAVIPKFKAMGATHVHDPDQPVFALDHDIQNQSPENLEKYARIREFAIEHDVAFYPSGRGIGHQVIVEEGFVLPGSFVVGSDSHSNLYGALGALGTPVVRTDAAAIWVTGRTWWQVPDVVKVTLRGRLQPGVTVKDVIITLIGSFKHDEVLNCCLEFAGPGAATLSIEGRMTIANMTTEWGALAGVFPYDEVTRQYLLSRAEHFKLRGDVEPRVTRRSIEKLEADLPVADPDAVYVKELDYDLSAVTPFVAGPNEVKTITPLPELEQRNVRIDKAFLMSCVNARLEDFGAAAKVIRGKRVADHVKFYIAAASSEVEELAKEQGCWQALVDAGAIVLPPGCGACIGLGKGVLEAGEVGISATNRNFRGRMGSRDAFVYLASPVVVAASAVAGKIAGPARLEVFKEEPPASAGAVPRGLKSAAPSATLEDLKRAATIRVNERSARAAVAVEIMPGFPKTIEGELLFVPKDNLNTDGIYGKDYTYREGLTPEQMAGVAMENYDPRFQKITREGDILVGGCNFGSGSSREQAATALKYRGLQMIIAGSFSQTYKRNAFNNGYICVECPELVDELKAACKNAPALTIRTGWHATVDFTRSQIEIRARSASEGVAAGLRAGRSDEGGAQSSALRTYSFSPLGEVAQELIVKGGFEAVIRDQLKE
ncbi:MAG: homoaconitase [Phycisphaerae bacterium]